MRASSPPYAACAATSLVVSASIVTALATILPFVCSASQPRVERIIHAAAQKNRIRRFHLGERLRRAAGDDVQRGNAEIVRVARDAPRAFLILFERYGAASRMRAHPLDADGARTRSHVPQQLPRSRCQARERRGAHVAFE